MEPRRSAPFVHLFSPLAPALIALAISAAGCGGPKADSSAASAEPIWTDSAAHTPPPEAPDLDEPRGPLDRYATDLQSMFDQLRSEAEDPAPVAEPAPASRTTSPPPAPTATAEPAPAPEPVQEETSEAPPAPEPAEPAADLTPAQRRAELLAQLSAMLARGEGDDAAAAEPPLRRAVRLAALEAIHPGAAGAELEKVERELLPAETAAFAPLRDLLARLGSASDGEGADPVWIAALLDEAAQRAGASRPLSIPAAALCQRVESFGRYTPFPSTTFAAGREHTAILYVEVAHFAQRAPGEGAGSAGSADSWTTELGQAVDLHHDADGSLQWRQPEQVVRDSSRRRRSDYYLVQRITLPATLSVGRYNLKVTVTDKISGQTAQARIPIQIVADPSLVHGR